MLPVDWPFTPVVLWLAFGGLLALLVVRTIRRDRREYQRFKRYRTTLRRQAMMRKWLLDSALSIGALSIVLLALSWQFITPLRYQLQSWIPILPWVGWTIVIGVALVFAGLTLGGLVAARRTPEEPIMIGDIGAMLPRNRQELRLGWLLSINAGLSEELMFRLAIPAVLYGASGSAILSLVVAVLLFGALHSYQGVSGVVGTTVVGLAMMFAYVATGTILVPIVLHILVDLRSLVVLPSVLFDAHKIDGRVQRFISRTPARAASVAPAAEQEDAAAEDATAPPAP